jgi:hypothetical protein
MLFTLKLPYKTLPTDADEVKTTIALVRHAVNRRYPEGVPRTEVRLWARLEDAFDEHLPAIDITLDQFKFLREACLGATWPPPWARLAVVLLDALDEAERTL